MKKHLVKVLTAVMLAALMFVTEPVQIFAAGNTQYVSDVRIAFGANGDEELKAAGYTVYDKQIGSNGYVYIGYKTTADPKEAITDLAVMNMNGGYSFDNYDNLLKEQADAVAQVIDGLIPAIEEYQANYAAGTARAVYAHDQLNLLIEDDSALGMGDFLLREIDRDELTAVMLQSTLIVINTIKYDLALACTDDWVERFLNADGEEDYGPELDDAVDRIFDALPSMQADLLRYARLNVPGEDEGEDVYAYFLENLTDDDLRILIDYGPAYEYLAATEYEDGTLLDFFMQDLDELDPADLYPMAAVMTPGQIASLDGAGLLRMFMYSLTDDESLQKAAEAVEGQNEPEAVSVYAGVDRSLFTEGGVALTDEAARKMSSSGDLSWYYGNISHDAETALMYLSGSALAVAGLSALTYVGGAIAKGIISYGVKAEWTAFVSHRTILNSFRSEAFASEWASNALAACGKVMSVAQTVLFVALAAAFLFAAVLLIWEAAAYGTRKVEYTPIPRVMVDDREVNEGGHEYIVYYAVMDQKGEKYADLNSWGGTQWLAMYQTKDKRAGAPIAADFLRMEKQYIPDSRYQGVVHAFGSTGAYDLHSYSGFHMFPEKTYLLYKTDPDALTLAATTVNRSAYALFAAGGVAAGAVGALLIEKLLRKKKKEDDETETA